MFEGKYLNDFIFTDVGWKPNGERSETNVVNGTGVMIDYYESGQKEAERHYEAGKLTFACGWWPDGEPNETWVENGKGVEVLILEDGRRFLGVYECGEVVDVMPSACNSFDPDDAAN